MRGAFSHYGAKLSATEKHRLRFFRGVCIRDVMTVRRESLASESLSHRSDHWDEAATYLDLVTQDYMSVENDEDAVRCDATLIELESGGPGGARAVRANQCYIIRSEARAAHSLSLSFHLALVILLSSDEVNAMSGPDQISHQRSISTLLEQSCCRFQHSRCRVEALYEIGNLSFHSGFISNANCFVDGG